MRSNVLNVAGLLLGDAKPVVVAHVAARLKDAAADA